MEAAMQVALTGLGCIPFTPRTPFETWVSGSKARAKTAPQAWTGPHGGWNYGQLAAASKHPVTKKPANLGVPKLTGQTSRLFF
ncbi:hypothetical protein DY78_GL000203 [Lactiplantibacillus fabifermentans DSM 21115]|uniref:Uncharacterized protein n=3 Tax=Lactiplantibacillus fabifermentans TaxID=483011 RepID=A0A0R2NS31_9LACO|nr:hypothetical protein DY78_GL000203 [Lactiplantibacillus fabifermentans DSM 21115]